MACLDPPLQAIPAGSWYCPPCRLLNRNHQNMNEVIDVAVVEDRPNSTDEDRLAENGCTVS